MKQIEIDKLANFIISYCISNDIEISHLKLQKLLYYTQAWHSVYFDKNQLFDEKPQAWVNGPVYYSVYAKLKSFRPKDYLNYLDETPEYKDKEYKTNLDILSKTLDSEQMEFLYSILKHYGLKSHEQLILSTHSELPWNEARKGLGPFDYSQNEIDLNTMYEYYKERLVSQKKTSIKPEATEFNSKKE